MMGKVTQDERINVKDLLIQRDQDRKEKIKTIKDEKEASAPDQVKLFHDSFEDHCQKITACIKMIEERKIDQKNLPDYFNRISKDIQAVNRYLSVSTVFLTNYSVRKCLQTIEELEVKVKGLETELLPKKKFGFKSRKSKAVDKFDKQNSKVDEVDTSVSNKMWSFTTISSGFSDKQNEYLKLGHDEIAKNDVELRNLESCTVFLCGSPSTVHISNVTKSKILCGPVSTSVFVENCHDCDFVIACQQLRVHATKNSRFYIHVTSKAIIEDSSNVLFAPYNLKYDCIERHFEFSGLDTNQNNWNKIDDFNWLASDIPSPNWKEMDTEHRLENWL